MTARTFPLEAARGQWQAEVDAALLAWARERLASPWIWGPGGPHCGFCKHLQSLDWNGSVVDPSHSQTCLVRLAHA